MGVEVVKYHNDFNKVSLGAFNELEQNLLFGILIECRNKQDIEFELSADDLARFVKVRSNVTNDELFKMACDLSKNFLKLDFRVVKRDGNRICRGFFNLFETLLVCSIECDNYEILEKIVIKVNPDFAYLINQLAEHFTQFELEEFFYLRGKYPKTLYRLLKRFRETGYYIKKWNDFREQMGIPPSFSNEKIETLILKPCVEKLSETFKTNLFDARIPFENLEYRLKKESSDRKSVV